jgi:hypothetical protein
MSWRFVASYDQVHTEDTYAIREYYTGLPGSDKAAWTVNAMAPQGETREDLIIELRRMLDAAESGEVLDLTLAEPTIVDASHIKQRVLNPDWS